MATVDTAHLLPLFIFGGLQGSLYSIVYSTALGNTSAFQMNTNILISWNSIAVGVGQTAAALPLIILGERVDRCGVWPLILAALLSGCAAFFLVFLNIPGNASYEATGNVSILKSSVSVALVAGFLMGVCDSFLNTGFYSFVSVRYEEEAAQANSVMKLISNTYSHCLQSRIPCRTLYWQLGVAFVAAIVAFAAFVFSERRANNLVGRLDVTHL